MIRLPFTRSSAKSAPPRPRNWRKLSLLGLVLNVAGLMIAMASFQFRPQSSADLLNGVGYLPAALCGFVGTVVILMGAGLNCYALHLRKRYAERNRRGQCEICGYDLRASADRCSECGTPVEKTEGVA